MRGGWMVLRTRPRAELFAAQTLSAKGVESFVPMWPAPGATGRSKPLFPGYLFARLQVPAEELPRVRSAPGVSYVLPRAAPPAVLPDALVEAVRDRASKPTDHATELGLEQGDPVVVVSGPFRWVEAVFDRRMNSRGRIRLLLDLVHGSATLDVQASAVRRLRSAVESSQPGPAATPTRLTAPPRRTRSVQPRG